MEPLTWRWRGPSLTSARGQSRPIPAARLEGHGEEAYWKIPAKGYKSQGDFAPIDQITAYDDE